MKYVPHPYQETARDWIMEHERCGLFLDMGLGKTVITLTAIRQLMQASQEVGAQSGRGLCS